jgi:hypothetical protein
VAFIENEDSDAGGKLRSVPEDINELLGRNDQYLSASEKFSNFKIPLHNIRQLINIDGFVSKCADETVLDLMAQRPEWRDDHCERGALRDKGTPDDELGRPCFAGACWHLHDGGLTLKNARAP